ncbi:hypothetical protein ACFVU2_02720 [Leifsonia sp. NPDC058194]|uniref:hypothetical protein n=1 Tax=Leifsonia sp. NPDC058194 TaxID=3346374 RepID=UPI0036DB1C9C
MSARTVRALWCVVPFALVVAVVAFALVGAPGIDHGLSTTKVPSHTVLTRREWVDIGIGALFTIIAVVIAMRLLRRPAAATSAGESAPR